MHDKHRSGSLYTARQITVKYVFGMIVQGGRFSALSVSTEVGHKRLSTIFQKYLKMKTSPHIFFIQLYRVMANNAQKFQDGWKFFK